MDRTGLAQEFLPARGGRVYRGDVNVLSNIVADAIAVVGFDPYARLVEHLAARGRVRAPARARA